MSETTPRACTDTELVKELISRGYSVQKHRPLAVPNESTLTRDELLAGSVKYIARNFTVIPLKDGYHSVRSTNARVEVAHLHDAELGAFFRQSFQLMQEQYDTAMLKERVRQAKPKRATEADLFGELNLDIELDL